ncbi:hypothetical protein RF650_13350, partial [Kocuria sp. CPCC 205297]
RRVRGSTATGRPPAPRIRGAGSAAVGSGSGGEVGGCSSSSSSHRFPDPDGTVPGEVERRENKPNGTTLSRPRQGVETSPPQEQGD